MGAELIGTRAPGVVETRSLADRLCARAGSGDHLALASAYWDAHACAEAIELAERIGGTTRLVLWTAGATRAAWRAALSARDSPALELRFIDSPAGGGIFHAKVAGLVNSSGEWSCALVGSANLTRAARDRNVELGVLLHDERVALAQLRDWFCELWAEAIPASELDFDTAIEIAPERSEAAARKRTFADVALAPAAPAAPLP